MNDIKICLGILKNIDTSPTEQLKLFKEVGFDGFFTSSSEIEIAECKAIGDKLGLYFQSIHAPFRNMRDMWTKSDNTESTIKGLIESIDIGNKYGVDTMVFHPYIGFGYPIAEDLSFGLNNFRQIVNYAKARNINVAFENVEGEAYLSALMEEFKNYNNVGFCWDSGHELCYNQGKDMLAIYGDRLFATHINDNLGVSGNEIYLTDDLHLLPFDGTKDWNDAMQRLNRTEFSGPMTFELKMSPDIDNKHGTSYTNMDFAEYLKLAYERASKLIKLRFQYQL